MKKFVRLFIVFLILLSFTCIIKINNVKADLLYSISLSSSYSDNETWVYGDNENIPNITRYDVVCLDSCGNEVFPNIKIEYKDPDSIDFKVLTSSDALFTKFGPYQFKYYVYESDAIQSNTVSRTINVVDGRKPELVIYKEAHVGLGYHRIISKYHDLKVEYTLILPKRGYVECANIKLTNESNTLKHFFLYSYFKPSVNLCGHTSCSRGYYDKYLKGLVYMQKAFKTPCIYDTMFVKTDTDIKSFDASSMKFIGVYNYLDNPVGLYNETLSNNGSTLSDCECAVYQYEITLDALESKDINISVGLGKTVDEAYKYANEFCSQENYYDMLRYQEELHNEYNKVMTVKTNDIYFDRLVNVWLKRQVSLGKTWGRVYGRGFRDVMQDICGFVSMDTKLAKERILYGLKYEFINGNTIRMYDPIFDEPYNDGSCWVPETINKYIKESGDYEILDEVVGYYDSDIKDTVYDHMRRGMDFLTLTLGSHGLVLWGGGDWNDSLNNCGRKGIGEGVWRYLFYLKNQ